MRLDAVAAHGQPVEVRGEAGDVGSEMADPTAGQEDSWITMIDGRGASIDKAKRELGWELRYAGWRHGFKEGVA